MRKLGWLLGAGPIVVALVGCGDAIEGQVEPTQSSIVSGLNLSSNAFSAAIYHWSAGDTTCNAVYQQPYSGWWTRPCSGTVIKRTATQTFVLTARHCVTRNGKSTGPLEVGTFGLRVSTDLAPGPIPNGDSGGMPPSSAVPASVFASGNPVNEFDAGEDLAIVLVGQPLATPATSRFGLYHGSTAGLTGTMFYGLGYGRSKPGDCDHDVDSGAGQLRYASWFTVDIASDKSYSHSLYSNPNAQVLWHGDSGGGSFLFNSQFGYSYLIGVHGTPTSDAGGANLASFIQSKMGALYLMYLPEYWINNFVVGAATVTNGAPLRYDFTGDSVRTQIAYNPNTGQLRMGAAGGIVCMQDNSPNPSLTLATCSVGANQVWTILDNLQVRNVGTGNCLLAGGGTAGGPMLTGSCANLSNSQWVWLSQPQP